MGLEQFVKFYRSPKIDARVTTIVPAQQLTFLKLSFWKACTAELDEV